jgi:hypothetical protein
MIGKCLAAIALVATPAGPASAQYGREYYVVQDTATKKCTIVEEKPTTSTVVRVGPLAFKSRSEAEEGMKTVKVCTSD